MGWGVRVILRVEIDTRVRVDRIANQADKPKNLGSYGVLYSDLTWFKTNVPEWR